MRLAIATSPQRTTWTWLREVWKRADELPTIESGWTFDHFYPLFGDSTEDCLEGWISLTALLQETTRIRGGVLVTAMAYRHPAVLANMAATLDITSGGRLELGVGAGWNEEETKAYGMELGTVKQRLDRFAEGLAVIDSLLTNDRTSYHGQYFHLEDAMCNPKPVQRPLPVCIGGTGRTRTLPLAARYADHWNYGGNDLAEFVDCRDVLHNACAAIDRDPATITCSWLVRWTGDIAAAREEVRVFEAAGARLALVSLPKTAPPSVVKDVAAALAP